MKTPTLLTSLLITVTTLSDVAQAAATGNPSLLARAECTNAKRDGLEDTDTDTLSDSPGNHTAGIQKRQYDGVRSSSLSC